MTGGFSGKKLFVGGLPPKVDEKALRDVFSRFWHIEEGLSVQSPDYSRFANVSVPQRPVH